MAAPARSTKAGGSAVEARKAAPVAAVRARAAGPSRDVEMAAEFRPFQEVDIHAKVAGYLKSIHVDVGDRVCKGQLIGISRGP